MPDSTKKPRARRASKPKEAPEASPRVLEVVLRPIAELTPFANNARTHSEQIAQLAASIEEFGWTNPVLIDEAGGLIAGHGRVKAASKLGREWVPTITIAGLSDTQKRALVLADNKLAENAGWNEDLLRVELTALGNAPGFDVSVIGFSIDELTALFDTSGGGSGADKDEVPPVEAVAITCDGEVWILGPHRVMCGDATSAETVVALMTGQLADLLVTDPPYNVSYTGKTKKALKIKNDSMGGDVFRAFLQKAFAAADAVMKPGSVFYIWHADLEGYNFRGACMDVGWKVRQCLVWKKQTLVLGHQDYQWKHEPCLYGWKDGAAHLWASDRSQTTVLEFDRPSRSEVHPTMKPVDLIQYQIENNTKSGELVLDVFGGSGTTLIAADKTRRHARLLEIDPRYVDVIVRRWQAVTGLEAVLESTGQTFAQVQAERIPEIEHAEAA